ncbi:hypothetical protein AWT69_004724 [Pseudomonas putida]|nr:hypothetical protein AWT69_004724 [Pseudomonas putida]
MSASMRRWKNWALSVAGGGLPTFWGTSHCRRGSGLARR